MLIPGIIALFAFPLHSAPDVLHSVTGTTAITSYVAQNTVSPIGCNDASRINVTCLGADPSGQSDSSQAIQKAVDQASGSPVYIPAGHYLLTHPIVIEAGNNSPGPRLEGAGQDATILEPCFAGTHSSSGPVSVIAVDGTQKKGALYPFKFANGGYLRGFTIDGAMAHERRQECPLPIQAALNGLEISGWWFAEIEDLHITNMGGDAIAIPWRHDIFTLPECQNPDCFASAEDEFKHLRLIGNAGWGVDAAAGFAFTYDTITESAIERNETGGIRMFGPQNAVINNAIAGNGCRLQNAHCVATDTPGIPNEQPGGGIFLPRFNPESSKPDMYEAAFGGRIERNELDSNYGYHVWVQGGDNVQIIGNRVIGHSDVWKTGVQGNYPHCQVVLGFAPAGSHAVVRNTYLRNNWTRSDTRASGTGDYEVQMYCVEPQTVAQTIEELDATFGPTSFNFSVLAAGGGAAAACSQVRGTVATCEMQSRGWYPAGTTPEVHIVGPGCTGVRAQAQMTLPAGATWGWIDSVRILNGGSGCTGAVWPVFSPVDYPAVNSLQNRFHGYVPKASRNPQPHYGDVTRSNDQ